MQNNKLIINIIITVLLIVSAVAFGYFKNITKTDNLKVLVTILPHKEIVKSVIGNDVEVTELVHAGQSPEQYSMSTKDLVQIENADIYFIHGNIPFEDAYLDRIQEINPKLKIVDLSKNLEFRKFEEETHKEEEHKDVDDEHEHSLYDPHYWLDPNNMIINAQNITDFMITYDPSNAETYTQNAGNYIKQLKELDSTISKKLEPIKNTAFLCFHPAWGYFTSRYGLVEYSMEKDGKDMTSSDLKTTIDMIRREDIRFIVLQKQFSVEYLDSISKSENIDIIYLDNLRDDYIQSMLDISNSILEASGK